MYMEVTIDAKNSTNKLLAIILVDLRALSIKDVG